MKKLNALLVLLALTAGIFAQGPFTIVSWVNMAADGTYPFWFQCYTLRQSWSFSNENQIRCSDWHGCHRRIRHSGHLGQNWRAKSRKSQILIALGGDPFDLTVAENGVDVDGTFGVAWKTFWDAENLYPHYWVCRRQQLCFRICRQWYQS